MALARLPWPVALPLAAALSTLGACDPGPGAVAPGEPDPGNGERLLSTYGCTACHSIPGVPGANRAVGPPLEGFAKRSFIAGLLPNTPEMRVRWIMNPQRIDPGNAMPDLRVGLGEARDMSAYLGTLE